MKDSNNIWVCDCGKNEPERYHKGLVEVYYCPVCFHHKSNTIHCNHADSRLILSEISNGTKQLRQQCNFCNSVFGNPIKQEGRDLSGIPLYLHSELLKIETPYDTRHKIESRLKERQAEWREDKKTNEYNNYINSYEWKEIAKRVKERDNWLCQSCLVRPATEVHHKTYGYFKNEPAFTLVSVCHTCHEEIHGRKF